MIRQALELSDELRLFSSPWSPPKWMKTNGRMEKGRCLRKDCRQVWADYFVRFLQEYEKEGIRIWGVTIQNEAYAEQDCDESALSETEREFLLPCVDSGIWRGEDPVVMDHETKQLHYSSSYYYMGHFSKFVRPGTVRIANSIYTDKLEVCTFVNPDGSIVTYVF